MSQKPLLYLVPGLLSDADVWAPQQEALAAQAELRVPDLRGLDSLEAMARRVLEEAPERFSLAGHSMGGRVAFEVARLAPAAGKTIERFAVLDSAVHPVGRGEAEKRQALLELATREGMAALAQAWTPPMLHPERRADAALLARIAAMVQRFTLDEYRAQVRALLGRADQRPVLDLLRRQPVLLVCGERDEWSPVFQHRAMQNRLGPSQLAVVYRAGHMVTLEEPEQTSAILLRWLQDPELYNAAAH